MSDMRKAKLKNRNRERERKQTRENSMQSNPSLLRVHHRKKRFLFKNNKLIQPADMLLDSDTDKTEPAKSQRAKCYIRLCGSYSTIRHGFGEVLMTNTNNENYI